MSQNTNIFNRKLGQVLDFPIKLSEIITTVGKDNEQGYVPLPFAQLPVERPVPFDIYLKVKIKDSPQCRFCLCCSRGEVFPMKWRQQLQRARISNIYFAPADVVNVVDYLEDLLGETMESPHRPNLEKAVLAYEVLQFWTMDFFSSKKGLGQAQIKLSLKCIDGLFQLIQQEETNIGFIFDIRKHNNTLYSHCLNVCLVGLAFVSYLQWHEDKARAFGLGALLHDIGLTEIPPELLQKKAALTCEERERIERHPNQGFKILKNFGNIWPDSLMMVLQHHENGDGSGYPQALQLRSIHAWARILRIIDSYDAMTAERPWRPARPPMETLMIMRNDWQTSQKYDPAYLAAFVKFLAGK